MILMLYVITSCQCNNVVTRFGKKVVSRSLHARDTRMKGLVQKRRISRHWFCVYIRECIRKIRRFCTYENACCQKVIFHDTTLLH